ncbi:MAG: sulfite exporter TauE/SafE family protein [Sedimentisphaerales bacterium]|nr:sulfite exporter TauE/SafE family protein [Sedimentisphaerales bacterium]
MEIVLVLIVVLVAGIVGTLTGFGLSTIMIPVMVLFYPLTEVLLFVGIVHWFSDVWKLVFFRQGIHWKLILSFGIPGILATILGAWLAFDVSSKLLSRILGVFLLVYVVLLFTKNAFQIRPSTGTAALGGALSGFFAGIFGMGGTIRSMFLLAFNLPKAVYLATAGAIALVIDSSRLATYVAKGAILHPTLSWGLLLFVPASFLGARIAKGLVDRIPQAHFRKVVAVFLLLVGLRLLFWPK